MVLILIFPKLRKNLNYFIRRNFREAFARETFANETTIRESLSCKKFFTIAVCESLSHEIFSKMTIRTSEVKIHLYITSHTI